MPYLFVILMLLLSACNLTTATQAEVLTPTSQSIVVSPTAVPSQIAPLGPTVIVPTTGNQSGGSSTNPACTVRSDWQTYTVVSGDTLGQIAVRTASDLDSLMTANCITNADALSVGQVLRVPSAPLPLPSTTGNAGSSGNLPRVGEVAGMPELSVCWASNPGTNPPVYDNLNGKAIAVLVNRAYVSAASNDGWVQVNYVGGANIADGTGWMRVQDVNLLGSCTETTGVQLDSWIPLVGNPAGVPDGVCAVVVNDPNATIPVYRDATGFQYAKMTGWGRWKSTQGNFYEVQYDADQIGWVNSSLASRINC